MNLTVKYVPIEYVAQTWPRIEKFIESAARFSRGDYTVANIQTYVSLGQWLLLVAIDEENKFHGAATVSFLNYPSFRVAFVTSIGGKLISNQDTFAQMVAILKQRGATRIQGAARPAIARLWKRYGFEEATTIVEVKI